MHRCFIVSPARSVRALVLCLGMGLLGACAQTLPVAPPVTACAPAAGTAAGQTRVLVRFRQPVDGASAAVLASLRQHGGACAVYLASVSDTVHAYGFEGVDDVGRLRERLQAWALVQDVMSDQKLTPRIAP